MSRMFCVLLILVASANLAMSQPVANPLVRRYRAGEQLSYRMTAINQGRHYSIQIDGVVKRKDGGPFYVVFRWSKMISNGKHVELAPVMADYRARFSLDPEMMPTPPDLSKADPRTIGPITDFLTIYSDLWLAAKSNKLHQPGDHFHFKSPVAPSWADGSHVLVGTDSIDFNFTLESVNRRKGIAVLEVRHVPPARQRLQLPAAWMKTPIGDTPNNWLQVERDGNGSYDASVGQETFDVLITVSLADGRILHAIIKNPVNTVERVCKNRELTQCGDAHRHHIFRKVEVDIEK